MPVIIGIFFILFEFYDFVTHHRKSCERSPAPMVLHGQLCGRVGRRRFLIYKTPVMTLRLAGVFASGDRQWIDRSSLLLIPSNHRSTSLFSVLSPPPQVMTFVHPSHRSSYSAISLSCFSSMIKAVLTNQVTTVIPRERIPSVTHNSTQVGR